MEEHPTWQELEGDQQKRSRWICHLLRGCRRCLNPLSLAAEVLDQDEDGGGLAAGDYDAALDRAQAGVQAQQAAREKARLRARRAAAELTDRRGLTEAFLRRHRHAMQGPEWVEALLEKSFAERYVDLGRMVDFAEMACNFARHLPKAFGETEVVDSQVRAKAELANAYRLQDRFVDAERALGEAGQFLDRSSQDPFLLARVFELTAAFLADKRQLSDACEMLDKALGIYQDLGQRHLAGRALSILALYSDYLGNHQEALDLIRDAIERIDPERDPQLAATSTQLHIWCLAENGEYREANRLLLASGLREKLAEEPLNLLKLRWVEGQIWAGLGKLERAESALVTVRHGFAGAGQDYRAALVGLDLAAVWLSQGKSAEVRELLHDMLETFRDLGVARESRRALEFFHEASASEQATPDLARHVRRFLQKVEHRPSLCFEAV